MKLNSFNAMDYIIDTCYNITVLSELNYHNKNSNGHVH